MNRYFSSFLLSLLFYTSVAGAIFYVQKEHFVAAKRQNPQIISLKVFSPKPPQKTIPEVIQKPKLPQKEVIQEVPPKKIILKAKPIQKTSPKPIAKKPQKPIEEEPIEPMQVQQEIPNNANFIEKNEPSPPLDLAKERGQYFALIHESINQNKIYPKLAQKRNIEDRVKVSFVISKEGNLISYEILEGKTLFHPSVIEAIKKSFPIKPQKNILNSNLTINMEIQYTLI